MRSVGAFTIIELLIAMVLSILVTILAFYSYQLIQKQYLTFKNYTSALEDYNSFVSAIQRDVEKAQAIFLNDEILYLKTGENRFFYQFEDTLVVRFNSYEDQKSDTFNISAILEYTSFEEKYIAEGFIDELEIQIKLFDNPINLKLHKWYSAQELFNHEH